MLDRGLSEDGAAQALGWAKARVTARVKILELPERAQQLVGTGVIPLSAIDQLRAIGAVGPALLEDGIRDGLLFARRDGEPWLLHDYQNWRRRTWHSARRDAGVESLPPYDLRHAFASLQIRAGMSIPELAEQMGHSPQMTLGSYAHVIRELKGEPRVSAEEQIERARRADGGRLVDVDAV